MNDKTRKIVITAVMIALTYVATTLIKIQTPTMGYIHLGDCVVLLCGYLLGPWFGAFAAGTGSMVADILSPYIIYAPGTFLIKATNAFVASLVFTAMQRRSSTPKKPFHQIFALLVSGILAESLMVIGYFGYDILVAVVFNHSNAMTLTAGIAYALTSVPFYIVKALVNIALVTGLFPVLSKVLPKINFQTYI